MTYKGDPKILALLRVTILVTPKEKMITRADLYNGGRFGMPKLLRKNRGGLELIFGDNVNRVGGIFRHIKILHKKSFAMTMLI